jgi:hypothetical protein
MKLSREIGRVLVEAGKARVEMFVIVQIMRFVLEMDVISSTEKSARRLNNTTDCAVAS